MTSTSGSMPHVTMVGTQLQKAEDHPNSTAWKPNRHFPLTSSKPLAQTWRVGARQQISDSLFTACPNAARSWGFERAHDWKYRAASGGPCYFRLYQASWLTERAAAAVPRQHPVCCDSKCGGIAMADHNDPNAVNSIFSDIDVSAADLYDIF